MKFYEKINNFSDETIQFFDKNSLKRIESNNGSFFSQKSESSCARCRNKHKKFMLW